MMVQATVSTGQKYGLPPFYSEDVDFDQWCFEVDMWMISFLLEAGSFTTQ